MQAFIRISSSPAIRSLAWKEWKERRGSLALATAWIVGGTVYGILDEMAFRVRGPVGTFCGTCWLYGLFAPVFLATRTALGERTQGTLSFSSALPASLRQIAAVRVSGAVVTLAAPIALGAAILSAVLLAGGLEQVPSRPPRDQYYMDFTYRPSLSGIEAVGLTWKTAAITATSAIELLLILAVIGARRRSEAQVGLIGAVGGFAWLVGTSLPHAFRDNALRWQADWLGAVLPQFLLTPWSYSGPDGGYQDLEFAGCIWGPLCLNGLLLIALGAWFNRRYGGGFSAAGQGRSWAQWRPPALLSRLPVRWPGRVAALAWLDLRQSVPLVLAGLALAFLMSVAGVYLEPQQAGLGESRGGAIAIACGQLPGSIWVVALLWSALVGSAIFGSELQPGLGHFWRSRPISVSSWYWAKFAVGLIAVLAVLDGVPIVLSWHSPYASGGERMSWSYIACMPPLHATLYALAVLGVCGLRRPMFAVVIAVLPYLMFSVLLQEFPAIRAFDPIAVYEDFRPERVAASEMDLTAHHYPVVYGAVAVIFVLAACSAFRATRRWNPVSE